MVFTRAMKSMLSPLTKSGSHSDSGDDEKFTEYYGIETEKVVNSVVEDTGIGGDEELPQLVEYDSTQSTDSEYTDSDTGSSSGTDSELEEGEIEDGWDVRVDVEATPESMREELARKEYVINRKDAKATRLIGIIRMKNNELWGVRKKNLETQRNSWKISADNKKLKDEIDELNSVIKEQASLIANAQYSSTYYKALYENLYSTVYGTNSNYCGDSLYSGTQQQPQQQPQQHTQSWNWDNWWDEWKNTNWNNTNPKNQQNYNKW